VVLALNSEPRLVAEIETENCQVLTATYPTEHWMSSHRHSDAHLFLCLRGAVEHHTGRDRFFVQDCTGGYVRSEEAHADLFLGGTAVFQITVGEKYREALGEPDSSLFFQRQHPAIKLLKSAYKEHVNPDNYTPIMLESLTLELLVSLRREQTPVVTPCRSRWLDRAREMIHEECSASLRLEDIAREVGVHSAHLSKAFRRRYGESIGEYIRKLRIVRAQHLLEISEMPISEIAFATGFADPAHFARTFKKYTGTTPLAYRGSSDARFVQKKADS
jgi:AraC-like DNA-binding protein